MKKVTFWGWYSDYDISTIESLKVEYNVRNESMSKAMRVLLGLCKLLSYKRLLYVLYNILIVKKLNKSELVIFSDDIIFYELIFEEILSKRKIIVFRNKIPANFENRIEKLRACGFEMYTFDNTDAVYYKIINKGQYLPCLYKFKIRDQKNSAYFLGLNKGRELILNKLSFKLLEHGIVPDITLVKKYNFGLKIYRGKISYCENIKKLLSSTYVIDVVSEGQTGLTLRALEAVFYNRKLITNNSSIKQYDFFNENNILIFNNNIEIPHLFITNNYSPIPREILYKYTAEYYYKDIIG